MFHIHKGTRIYEGHGYCGPSSLGQLCEFYTLDEARAFERDILWIQNPGVQWIIVNSETYEEFIK